MTDEALQRLAVALFGEAEVENFLLLAALRQVPREKRVGLTHEQLLDLVAEVLLDWYENPEERDSAGDELNEKLYAVDMRDGELDGKNQRSIAVKCPQCNRMVSPRHAACLYCRHIMDDSVFSLT